MRKQGLEGRLTKLANGKAAVQASLLLPLLAA